MASILPFERHVKWSRAMELPRKVSENLLTAAGLLGSALLTSNFRLPTGRLPSPIGSVVDKLTADLVNEAGDKLRQVNSDALARHDHLAATLSGFRLDLDRGEQERVLLRSRR